MLGAWFLCLLTQTADGTRPPDAVATDAQTYEAAKAKAGRNADAQVRLALWCEAHGMNAERLKHLAIALLVDPAHPLARGLLGFVNDGGAWRKSEDAARRMANDAALAKARAEYERKRSEVPNQAEAHYRLALWCDQNGLKAEAKAHLHHTLGLDPKREDAWKRLGYKRYGNRWMTDAQIAASKREAEAQAVANRAFKTILEAAKSGLTGRQRKADAERTLSSITDPRAVPMIVHVFGLGNAAHQVRAVQLLGQINGAMASRALATLAVYGKSPEVRRVATETLRQRDVREFGDLLIQLLRDPIKYEVKPVGGPGSPGELWVEGQQYDRKRHYLVPKPFGLSLLPGDRLGYDSEGLPVISRIVGETQYSSFVKQPEAAILARAFAIPMTNREPPGIAVGRPSVNQSGSALPGYVSTKPAPGSPATNQIYEFDGIAINELAIPIGRMERENQMAVASARNQLERDVASIEAINAPIRVLNDRVLPILETVTGNRFGEDQKAWSGWFADVMGFALRAPQETARQIVEEAVQPNFVPQSGPTLSQQTVGVRIWQHSCFASGTQIRTIGGLRPIQDINLGNVVLSQNDETGELSFQPVVRVYHNPPNRTLRIKFKDAEVVCTGIHRLWVAGRGWVMARELKAGDALRTSTGVSAVVSVSDDAEQPVFNLRVAESHSFFVGKSGVLAHDNSDYKANLTPFDAMRSGLEIELKPGAAAADEPVSQR
jgi:hypothetical protein